MNKSQIGDNIYVTIWWTISAGIGLLASPVLGIPGFLNAIHSACKIEKPENIIDQTGLKYLALVDKRLRRQWISSETKYHLCNLEKFCCLFVA